MNDRSCFCGNNTFRKKFDSVKLSYHIWHFNAIPKESYECINNSNGILTEPTKGIEKRKIFVAQFAYYRFSIIKI